MCDVFNQSVVKFQYGETIDVNKLPIPLALVTVPNEKESLFRSTVLQFPEFFF